MNARLPTLIVLTLALQACWQRQDHAITGPEWPHYTLSGYTVDLDDATQVLPHSPVSLQATLMLYDVTFDPVTVLSDTSGYYQIDSVYPGDYILTAEREGYLVVDERLSMGHAARQINIELPKPFLSLTSYRSPAYFPPRYPYNPQFTFAPRALWIMSTVRSDQTPELYDAILIECAVSINDINEIRWIHVPFGNARSIEYAGNLLHFYFNGQVTNLQPLAQTTQKLVVLDTVIIDTPLEDMAWDGTGFWTTWGSSLHYRGTHLDSVEETWQVKADMLSALTIKGNDIWAYDKDRGLILKLDRQGKVRLTLRPINSDTGEWVTVHDMEFSPFGTLWVSDKDSRYFIEFNTRLLEEIF